MGHNRTCFAKHFWIFLFLLGLYFSLFLLTLNDYGISFDEANGESFLGDRYFTFFLSGDFRHFDFSGRTLTLYSDPTHPDLYPHSKYAMKNAHHVWGFGHTIGAASKWFWWEQFRVVNPINAHHIGNGILSLLLFIGTFIFCFRLFSPFVAWFSVLLLMSHPRLWAHMHYNAKDIPELFFYSFTVFSFAHGILEKKMLWIFGAAVFAGLALATKGNALFLFPTLACFSFASYWLKGASGKMLFAGLGILLLSFPIALLAWPFLLADFPSHVIQHGEFLLSRGLGGNESWNSRPFFQLIGTTPPSMLFLIPFGGSQLVRAIFRGSASTEERSVSVLLLVWSLIPLLRVSIPHADDFDGIRHWMEVLVPLVIVTSIGAQRIIDFFCRRFGNSSKARFFLRSLLVSSLFPTLWWNIANHPFQFIYYNQFVGGLGGAQRSGYGEAGDYWGISYRNAMNWLNDEAPKGAVVYVGFAQHIFRYTEEIWMRSDLQLGEIKELKKKLEERQAMQTPSYLVFLQRENHTPSWLTESLLSNFQLVRHVLIDGGDVYRIYRIDSFDTTRKSLLLPEVSMR
jgi:hypothetical protein